MERWCCQTWCGHAAMRNPVEQPVFAVAWFAGHAALAALLRSRSHPVFPICPRGLWRDHLRLLTPLTRAASPEAALTSRFTLGYVAKSLHKLVREVSSPTSRAEDFTTPWNREHPRTVYTLTPFLNFVLSPLCLSWWEQALPSLQRF